MISLIHFSRKGDHYRYLAEIKTGTDRKEAADKSLNSYEVSIIQVFIEKRSVLFVLLYA